MTTGTYFRKKRTVRDTIVVSRSNYCHRSSKLWLSWMKGWNAFQDLAKCAKAIYADPSQPQKDKYTRYEGPSATDFGINVPLNHQNVYRKSAQLWEKWTETRISFKHLFQSPKDGHEFQNRTFQKNWKPTKNHRVERRKIQNVSLTGIEQKTFLWCLKNGTCFKRFWFFKHQKKFVLFNTGIRPGSTKFVELGL